MNALTGPQVDDLAGIIVQLFNASELKQLVRVALDIQLYNEVAAEGQPLRDTALALIGYLERRRITVTLLIAIVKLRPNVDSIQAFCQTNAPEALRPAASVSDQVGAVVAGVNEMRRHITEPAVRDKINASRPKLEQIGGLITWMGIYKNLHDCLHQVQVRYYKAVIDAARHFRAEPENIDIADELDGYVAGLRALVVQMRANANGLPADGAYARGQELQWIGEMETEAIGSIREAIDTKVGLPANRGALRLKSLLITEPSRINQMLTFTAAQLPLDQLIQTLDQVVTTLAARGADGQAIATALTGLQSLYPRLIGQIAQHTQWQRVEKELWHAADIVGLDTDEARDETSFFWTAIKADVQALAELDKTAAWAADVARAATDMDNAIAGSDGTRVRSAFERYRRRALLQSFEVDVQLKSLCGTIADLGNPLNTLLQEAL